MKTHIRVVLLILAFLAAPVFAQSTQLPDFTYQGQLQQNGQAATGQFDLSFALYDAATGGQQVGTTINESQFPVTDGLFTVSLSFPGAFVGDQRWLEVSVNGQPLTPRQAVSTTPVAQYALNGNEGPMGPQGPMGNQGPAGPAGVQGATGAQGPAGPAGAQGATGAQGSAGPAGAQGPIGPIGQTGAAGAAGSIGPQGLQGPQGVAGPAGERGEPGESFPDAPVDGKIYARRNNAWVEVTAAGQTSLSTAILADAPTLYYPLDEAAGAGVMRDLGPGGFDVAVTGSALTLQQGWSRLFPTSDASHLRMNEGNGKAMVAGNPLGTATPAGSLTVTAIYSPHTNGSGYQPILFIGDDSPALPFVSFGVVNLQPRMQVGNDTRVDLSGLFAGRSYHIAASVDATLNQVRIYVNGHLLQVQSMFGYPFTLVAPKIYVASVPADDRPFVYATLGHVALFYGQALTADQIAAQAKAAGLYGY